MKLTQITGKTDSRKIKNIKGYETAVVASGYSPEGFTPKAGETSKDRHNRGCRQVVVAPSASGESWVCTEIVTGDTLLFPINICPEWAGEMAAAEFGGEFDN